MELHQRIEAYLLLMGASHDDTQMEHAMAQLEIAQKAAEADRQIRSLGSSARYQRVPALAGLAQDDSGLCAAWEGEAEEGDEYEEEGDDGEGGDGSIALGAIQTLEKSVGDEGNEYSIALAALTGRFQKSKKGGKGGKKGTLGKGPGAPASGSSALANATPKSKAKASRKCKFGANCEDMRKNIP